MPFTVQYAVPMTCGDCVTSIKEALAPLPGVQTTEIDLDKKLVTVSGEAAPSRIVAAMQAIGRDAIVRGSGRPNSAAVCILETNTGKTRGLCRLIEDDERKIIVDCTAALPNSKDLEVSVHASGDLSAGALSTGPKMHSFGLLASKENETRSLIARVSLPLADIIGRSVVVGPPSGPTSESLAGVIARSAGLWENDKVICSCTGMTLWDERKIAETKSV